MAFPKAMDSILGRMEANIKATSSKDTEMGMGYGKINKINRFIEDIIC